MSEFLKNNLTAAPNVKVLINIGALMDVPTGFYVRGKYNEMILLGGLGSLTGMTGIGNSFKSTIMHYMMLSAAARIYSTTGQCVMDTYDTEMNIHEERLRSLTYSFEVFKDADILNNGTWTITDKTVYLGDKWFELKKEFMRKKVEGAAKILYETPFLDRDRKSNLKVIVPTFTEVDSFSEFETSDVSKILEENELGEAGGNTVYMRQGLAKNRFMMEMPALAGASNNFTLLSAQLGKEINMASGPYAPPPTKKLQHMNVGDKIKGVSDKFFFLTNNFWQTKAVSKLINQGTKGPEYPRDSEDVGNADCDLNLVSVILLRGKSGPSGIVIELVVSQTEGVLPSLTEFHYIKENDRFGISGTLQNYALDIYPDCRLSRTAVRGKIDNDVKLVRALNITAEWCQMKQHHRELNIPDPKTVYEGIKANGYDWDMILESSRGWWTVNNDSHPLKFLSALDIIRMAKPKDHPDHYHPYWMDGDCRTIKKEFNKV